MSRDHIPVYNLSHSVTATGSRAMSTLNGSRGDDDSHPDMIYVDIIVPAHNASSTIEATIESAMQAQAILPPHFDVAICCYNDGSTDDTHEKLTRLQESHPQWRLLTDRGKVSRGAGFARNRAATMRELQHQDRHFLCLLDSDDIMHPQRIMEQVAKHMMGLSPKQRHQTILGCQFDRDPPDSTWHYAEWANGLSDERIMLERYRELTIIQPTWVMTKYRFQQLGGYVEAPIDSNGLDLSSHKLFVHNQLRLVHTTFETPHTMRLAEDLRFMYAHLYANGKLALHRTSHRLLTYRHIPGMSQSSQTPRKLILYLRVLAMEISVLSKWKTKFVVWGAGRDGKDFVKALRPDMRDNIYCFVDVDDNKLEAGAYVNKEIGVKIPIVHFSNLIKDQDTRRRIQEMDQEPNFGRIQKGKTGTNDDHSKAPPTKRRKLRESANFDTTILPDLPVVVCVAMYRTNGALEANVASIGRHEGENLWHFS